MSLFELKMSLNIYGQQNSLVLFVGDFVVGLLYGPNSIIAP